MKKSDTMPHDVYAEIQIDTVIYGDYDKLVGNLEPGKRLLAIYRVNNVVEFVNYQEELMANWIQEELKKQILAKCEEQKSNWGITKHRGTKPNEVRGLGKDWTRLFQRAMEAWHKAYPDILKGKELSFKFRFHLTPDLFVSAKPGQGTCWSAMSIEFMPAGKNSPTKNGCKVNDYDKVQEEVTA